MKRLAISFALAIVAVTPALAGHDRYDDDDDDYYYSRHYRGEYRGSYANAPAYREPSYEVYIPYGAYFGSEPERYGSNCEVEREWRRGHYRETIECDDDD